ncbi:MAG: hypothetical protein R3C53_20535 [Pirellulaceae bacterium]
MQAQFSFDLPPINYFQSEPNDPVAQLVKQVEAGDVTLTEDPKTGYLVSLLRELKIPVSSQTLVFSKTSLQRHLISPSNPRAIYFNDATYVGWVPHGELIEVASVDPKLGANFYTIEQFSQENPVRILRRTERCLFCHASSDTGRVPGLLMQSVFTSSSGNRVFPSDSVSPKSDGPLQLRFSGWFVTGKHGEQTHLGNLQIESDAIVDARVDRTNGNVTDLSAWFDVKKYLSPHSDLVALLVLQHQVTMHNLFTLANHQSRTQLHRPSTLPSAAEVVAERTKEDSVVLDQIAERVVDGLLMVGDLRLTDRISGTGAFVDEFSQQPPRDSRGRSLREFDLRKRLFRYPCSYLIYSEAFDALPAPLLESIYRRLHDVLERRDSRSKYEHLSEADRIAITSILTETKPGFASAH